jgi:activating signal cointegrator complex subunit 1
MRGVVATLYNYLIFAADLEEISNSERKQVVDTSMTDSEILASDKATNVVIGVTTNNASSSENYSAFGSSTTKVVTEATMGATGEKYTSAVEVCWADAFHRFMFSAKLFFFL